MSDTTTAAPAAPLRAAQERAGAVFREVAGREAARHYGDGLAEYRAVRDAAGVAERGDRARIRLWGRDPVRMVQGLITNDLAKAPAGRAVYAAMLTAKGRMIADLRAIRRETAEGPEVLLDLPREALEATREHLKKFVPPMFARWAEVTDTLAEIGVYGPRAAGVLARALGAELPPLDEDDVAEPELGGVRLVVVGTREAGGVPGCDVLVPAEQAEALWTALLEAGRDVGARPVGFGALETLRIEAGRPRYGVDMTEETIPTEAYESSGMLARAISFTKGCYTGQEVIVRIAHRGHVNRHLRGLLLGDVPTPAPRTPLLHSETGREVGWITSGAESPLLGQTIALGYVRREVEPGGRVRLGTAEGAEAEVVQLPFRAGE